MASLLVKGCSMQGIGCTSKPRGMWGVGGNRGQSCLTFRAVRGRPGYTPCFMRAVPLALDHQAGQRGGEQLASQEAKQPRDPSEPCVCDSTRQLSSGPPEDKLGGVRVLEREGDWDQVRSRGPLLRKEPEPTEVSEATRWRSPWRGRSQP